MCCSQAALGTPENTNICFQYLSHLATVQQLPGQRVIICEKSFSTVGGGGGGDHPLLLVELRQMLAGR